MTPNFPAGDFWRRRYGPALRIETPLHPGTLALGAHLQTAAAGRDTDPAADPMRWSLLYLGWGRELTSRLLELGAEVRVGALVSSVDYETRLHPLGAGEARGLLLGLGSSLGGH